MEFLNKERRVVRVWSTASPEKTFGETPSAGTGGERGTDFGESKQQLIASVNKFNFKGVEETQFD